VHISWLYCLAEALNHRLGVSEYKLDGAAAEQARKLFEDQVLTI
jgi:hypothetical protein